MGWSQESGGGGVTGVTRRWLQGWGGASDRDQDGLVTGVSRAGDRGEEGQLTGESWDRPGGVAWLSTWRRSRAVRRRCARQCRSRGTTAAPAMTCCTTTCKQYYTVPTWVRYNTGGSGLRRSTPRNSESCWHLSETRWLETAPVQWVLPRTILWMRVYDKLILKTAVYQSC